MFVLTTLAAAMLRVAFIPLIIVGALVSTGEMFNVIDSVGQMVETLKDVQQTLNTVGR